MFSLVLRLCGLILPVILVPAAAHANVQIFPTRIEFTEEETTQTITIRNKKETTLTVQISPRDWNQDGNGQDRYRETDDLLVFPRMATLDPGGEQKLRLRYRGKPGEVERAFRLLVEEIPAPQPGTSAMRFVVTMSVPIFVLPQNQAHDATIENTELKQGAVQVALKNAGTVHEQAAAIRYRIMGAGGTVLEEGEGNGWYVLPGRTRTFRVNVPEAPCRKGARIAVKVALNGEEKASLTGEAAITPGDCKAPPKPKKPALNE